MLGYASVAPRYPVEMPRILADAGYTTAALGKNHFGWNQTSGTGIQHGYEGLRLYDGLGRWKTTAPHNWSGEFDDYDMWFEQQMPGVDPAATLDSVDGDGWNTWHARPFVYDEFYHPTAWLGRQAVGFIQNHTKTLSDTPFFLKVSFHRPHSPYDPPMRVLNEFNETKLPPVVAGTGWDAEFQGPNQWCGPNLADAWCGEMPSNATDYSRRAYYASVAFVDEQIDRIYNALDESGVLENTYILFTADHGDGQGEHYHWRKGFPYEFSAHVPMLLRWPESAAARVKIMRGATLPQVSELRDVLHTVIDAAEAQLPQSQSFNKTDGKSLLCLLADPSGSTCDYQGNPGPWRQWLDLEHSTVYNATVHWNALTDGSIKYIFHAFTGAEQLFNITADPKETKDLAQDPASAAELGMWRQRMVDQFNHEGRGPDWVKNGKLQIRTKSQSYGPNYPGK